MDDRYIIPKLTMALAIVMALVGIGRQINKLNNLITPLTTQIIMEEYINQKVIVRADRAGVFFGTLIRKEGNEVELKDCRRLWYWRGAASISEIAVNGVKNPRDCKFTVPVKSITILGVIEIIPCEEKAIKCIESVPVWKISD